MSVSFKERDEECGDWKRKNGGQVSGQEMYALREVCLPCAQTATRLPLGKSLLKAS